MNCIRSEDIDVLINVMTDKDEDLYKRKATYDELVRRVGHGPFHDRPDGGYVGEEGCSSYVKNRDGIDWSSLELDVEVPDPAAAPAARSHHTAAPAAPPRGTSHSSSGPAKPSAT